jgi:glycogen operon protein
MVTDSLRYWAEDMHVDGFRFDLGTILAREPGGFDTHNGFMKACLQDPVLSKVKLIAEPWDCGPGGYQVGGFPPGWAEWNDKFRDTVRDYWRGEANAAALAPRLCASPDIFNHRGRQPWASVNFITAHDGFTLNDLVSYNDKHNEANKEDNRDGSSNNHSWNSGAEGETDDPEILKLRERQKRNFIATLFFSQGTPMLLAGDEFGNTQYGNNNAYCQDNEDITWLDWEGCTDDDRALTEFTRRCIALRNAYPILRRSRFFVGQHNPELDVKDVTWVDPRGLEKEQESWNDPGERCFGMVLDGRAQPTGIVRPGSDATLLLILNAYHDVVPFALPEVAGGTHWRCLVDSNIPERADEPVFASGEQYEVTGRSLLLFVLQNGEPRTLRAPLAEAPRRRSDDAGRA